MHLLRVLHRYLGAALALFILLMALSGTALLFKETIWRVQYPALTAPLPSLADADHAAAMTTLMQRHPGSIRFIQWPQPGLAAYQVWFDDGSRAFYAPEGLGLIDRWQWHESPVGVLERMHFTLLLGHTGETLAGYAGLAAVLMVLSGVVLWWPTRRRPLRRGLWPGRLDRGPLVRSHRNWGVLAAPLLLLVLATGTGVAFYGPLSTGLSKLFGAPSPSAPEVEPAPVEVRAPAVKAAIAGARERFPGGEIVFFYPHTRQAPVIKVRVRQAELHPSGTSYVYADARTGQVLKIRDSASAPGSQKLLNGLYPVHSTRIDGLPGFLLKVLALLAGTVLALVTVTGVLAYGRSLLPVARKPATYKTGDAAYRTP